MIDIIARGLIEESNGDISQLSETVTTHTENDDIHVTTTDKENWNSHPNDVTAIGNPVTLNGLQGGVPFSEMIVSGKNLISMYGGTNVRCEHTISGDVLTLTPSNMSDTSSSYYYLKITHLEKNKEFTFSVDFENNGRNSILMAIWQGNKQIVASQTLSDTKGNIKINFFADIYYDDLLLLLYARKINTVSSGSVIYKNLQLELGSTATAYEPPITGRELTVNVNGTEYTITPDSNPYTVPNDIRQQDGLNVVSVSEGEISVTGVRKNAAIKRIWDEMGMDLLFDGVTSADNPAVIDLANYKFVEIHHIMIANEKAYPSNIRLSLDSYLSSTSTITIPIVSSAINTIHTEEGTISSLYAISAAGDNMNNTKIYGIK